MNFISSNLENTSGGFFFLNNVLGQWSVTLLKVTERQLQIKSF